MKFGLPDTTIENIQKIFEANAKVDEVIVFGSRAKGNYKEGSDIDLAVKGRNISFDDILKLHGKLDDLNLPYKIDLLDYAIIKEPALVEHIDRVGIVFYERWKKSKLGQLCNTIDYGYTASANDNAVGPKFLRITDIVPQKVNWETVPYCKIDDKNHRKYKLEKGDIVIARTGATTGYNYTFNDDVDAVFASYLIRYKIDKARANPFFINYSLKSDGWKGFVEGIIGGSAQPGANAKMFAEYELLFPPLNEQQNIVDILSSLDDKIDLLQRQNKTLEQLAETLFRQWFIEEADESWEVGNLDDIVSVKGGTTPSTANPEYWSGDIHWTSPRDLSNNDSIFLFDTERKISEKGLAQIGSGLLPVGTVLLSSRAPIGYLTINEIPVAINQGYIAIICDKIVSNYFIFLWCKANMNDIENASNGSVFQEISKSSFKSLSIIIPSKKKLKNFDDEVESIFLKIKSNTIQIKQLAQLRDALLPKLMSGEVRVN